MKKVLLNIYPFLFAAYPVFALRSQNLVYVNFNAIIRSLLLSFLITAIILLFFKLVTKDWNKAGLITSLLITLLFSYGHIYLQFEILFEGLIRHRYLAILFLLILILIGASILRLQNSQTIIQFLANFSLILLLLALSQAITYDFSLYKTAALAKKEVQERTELTNQNKEGLPDIYLIILDGYTRADVLEDAYNFDNSDFTENLRNLGFYVADCSQSNYPITKYSLSSIMNADYVQNYSNIEMLPPLKTSFVNQTLQNLGYTTIAFENSVSGHFDLLEDIHISRNQQAWGLVDLVGGPNEFEAELLKTTLFKLFYDMPQLIPGLTLDSIQKAEHYEHYRQTFFILDELENIPQMSGHNFIFAHILVPHPPYIFAPSGKFQWTDNKRSGYISNIEFINAYLIPVIKTIIEKSDIQPIIIIQGDHGAFGSSITPQMRLSILNAYYVNTESKASLYSTITPVNSFRIIFNHYFDADFPLLEDLSYFMEKPDQFTQDNIIKNNCTTP